MGLKLSAQMQGHAAMLLFSFVVAGSFSLGGSVANDIAPTAFNAVRFWIAAIILGAITIYQGNAGREHFAKPWRYLGLGSMYVAYFVLMFVGLKTAPPVNASAVFTLTPILAAIFGIFIVQQVVSRRIAIALAFGGAGAIWVIFRGDIDALMAFQIGKGEAIYFIGVISHAFYTPFARRWNFGTPVITYTFGTLLTSAVLITIYGWGDLMATDWAALRPLVWITLLYIAVFATSLSSLLLLYATMRLPSSKVMAYTYLVPSWVIVWEMVRHGYLPPVIVLAGVGLTLLALLLLLRE